MNKNRIMYFLVLAAAIILSLSVVYGAPTRPLAPDTLTDRGSSTLNASAYGTKSLYAEAGNLTELYIYSRSQTRSWQGYYGNISGVIVLDDAYNYTLYSWALAEPQGEIYVVNETISDWATAHCFNYTAAADGGGTYNYSYDGGKYNASTSVFSNLTIMEKFYNISDDNVDGINETFNVNGLLSDGSTSHNQFYVGTTNILAGTCPATDLYENDSATGVNFQEVLLQVNNSAAVIWTAIIENDIIGNDTDNLGYNGKKWDFEILVAEDGSSEAGQDTTTQYYFYVELE